MWWALLWLVCGLAIGLLWGRIIRFGHPVNEDDEYPWWDNEDWGDKK